MVKLSAHATFVRLREWWQRHLLKRRSLTELAACPPNELSRIAQDVGLSVSDLRTIAEAPRPWRALAAAAAADGARPRICQVRTNRDLSGPGENVCGLYRMATLRA